MNKTGVFIVMLLIVIGGAGWFFAENMPQRGAPMTGGGMNPPSDNTNTQSSSAEEKALPIPPLLEDKNPEQGKAEFDLIAQEGTTEFFNGKESDTYGYNGNYLGPVIRVRNGDDVKVNVKNELSDATTVHWHGLEVDGTEDGGPHSGIESGETWDPEFPIEQPAATLWYHPHLLHKTGEQVYKGLAGMFIIEDDISDSLNIPKEYGENDIPLIVQDKQFSSDGTFEYNLNRHDIMMGLQGDTVLVNGAVNPYLEVPQGKVRLRVLNGSNARTYNFKLSNDQKFHQIASDGGFLEQPAEMTNVVLSSAERAEIIVDFSEFEEGDTLELTDQGTPFMSFRVTGEEGHQADLPGQLTTIEEINPSEAVRTREFVFQGMGRNVNINGKQMDINRIDEVISLNETEIWEITNEAGGMMGGMGGNGGMIHPFHAHGVQFQVLDRDGNPPPPNETGWKDTILVSPGEKVRVIATFEHPGVFMYHCHILEHEDAGMMGQFEVE
ncbi:multicopper oxidase family protein [Salipaludibacillus aurantiacus]|uniref:Multicopper oxidase with three cupredoxin domains (Includes cell division protein FtsP and spore coat protein CotA) n=1 Tax=Salipaludibacillus aurantiacus TaxID=1601833 RepID=A0A1H9UBQ0_9BACI|nr:multicopper oxidase domain-containing protein [Salipaludibacillus aurantiacus]SES06970.1 Multicopper oxidase with three cupredoxin domains (includes cell division protein FtsP and spore coat protein CotA) [Salipaludibacillus aurantiacus]